jgi:hypothetical protein
VGIIPDTIGSFTVGIDLDAIRAERTLRAEWLLAPSADGETPRPSVQVAYAHLDRFLVTADADCGETVTGRETAFVRNGELVVPPNPFGDLGP